MAKKQYFQSSELVILDDRVEIHAKSHYNETVIFCLFYLSDEGKIVFDHSQRSGFLIFDDEELSKIVKWMIVNNSRITLG